MEDIGAKTNILNNPVNSDISSLSAEEVGKSSFDTFRPDIMEEITEKVINVLHEYLNFLIIFTQKDVTRNLKNFRNITSKKLAEILKNIKLLENISNKLIFNKFYEKHHSLQNLPSPRQSLQNIENVHTTTMIYPLNAQI